MAKRKYNFGKAKVDEHAPRKAGHERVMLQHQKRKIYYDVPTHKMLAFWLWVGNWDELSNDFKGDFMDRVYEAATERQTQEPTLLCDFIENFDAIRVEPPIDAPNRVIGVLERVIEVLRSLPLNRVDKMAFVEDMVWQSSLELMILKDELVAEHKKGEKKC